VYSCAGRNCALTPSPCAADPEIVPGAVTYVMANALVCSNSSQFLWAVTHPRLASLNNQVFVTTKECSACSNGSPLARLMYRYITYIESRQDELYAHVFEFVDTVILVDLQNNKHRNGIRN